MTRVAAVLPAYNVEREIGAVLLSLPSLFDTVIVVNDGSRDQTGAIAERHAATDPRITVLHHAMNRGVGAAMITGFRAALEVNADIIVKIDADGQMPLWLVPQLIAPLIRGDADYTKGNRFRDFEAVSAMPFARRVGNVALSFLAKAATGYWRSFDPTNGFVAIRADVLSQLPLHKIDPTYFFEISMLSRLYLIGAVVKEIPCPARYAGETSSLSIPSVLRQFPGRLLWSLIRRIVLKHYVYDFNLASLHLAIGLPLFLAGVGIGGWNWIWYTSRQLAAPTGTVVLPALMIMVGVQLLLSAMQFDLEAVPREPMNRGPLAVAERQQSAPAPVR
ncbi:MAG TPA: glycosyltransferase family 2 protein [Thermoanaerobaculia bacterium]|jgi:glycosyltransferase involved in cell wall biosynthesis|nr:glycosyltransferase family 2 protein [Thermoanaerobaculia bacterium]